MLASCRGGQGRKVNLHVYAVLRDSGRVSCRGTASPTSASSARQRLTSITDQGHFAFGLHQKALLGRGQKALQGAAQNFLQRKRRKETRIIIQNTLQAGAIAICNRV